MHRSPSARYATFLPAVLVAAVLVGTVSSCGSATLNKMDAGGGNGGVRRRRNGGGGGGGRGGTVASRNATDSGDGACVDTMSDGKNCGAWP